MADSAVIGPYGPSDVSASGPPAKLEKRPSWIRGGAKAMGLLNDPDALAKKFQSVFQACDDYRAQFTREWLVYYQQYNGQLPDLGKEPWQSNINIPLPTEAVDVACSRVVKAMFQDEENFEIDPETTTDDQLVEFAKKAVSWQLRKSKSAIPVKESVKDAFICGNGYVKVHFQRVMVPRTRSKFKPDQPKNVLGKMVASQGGTWGLVETMEEFKRLRAESIIPTNVWKDWTGLNRFMIQRIPRTLSDVWAMTKDERDPATGEVTRPAVYDIEQVKKIRDGMTDPMRQQEESTIKRDMADIVGAKPFKGTDLYEFWGDFYDPDDGALLFKNVLITFADLKYTIRMAQRNPFWHGMAPIIHFVPKLVPHQVYGCGLLMPNARIHDATNAHYNVLLDKARLSIPMLECDAGAAKDSASVSGKPVMKPGKFWYRRANLPPDRKIFYPVTGFEPVNEFDIQLLEMLKNEHRGSTQVNEFATGQPTSTNRKTKEEVQARVAATEDNFNDAAAHLEETGISPFLQVVYYTMIQFEDQYDDPTLMRAFGDDPDAQQFLMSLKGMAPEERWHNLFLDTEFRAVGITNSITRQNKMQNFQGFMGAVASDPMLSTLINKQGELEYLIELWKAPKKILVPNWQAAFQQAQGQGAMAGAMAPPQQGGQGGPPGQTGPQAGPPNPHNQLAKVSSEAARGPRAVAGGPPRAGYGQGGGR